MRTRAFGTTGIEVSEIGLGAWQLVRSSQWPDGPDEDEAVRLVHAALAAGVTFIDTAPGYAEGRSETVLGGALRGKAARDHLLDTKSVEHYMIEGIGCRCVDDNPWYTLAETCELVLALDAAGLTTRAQDVLGWSTQFRKEHGGYWTGKTWPENVHWPLEDNAWTAAAVLLANDALGRKTVTSELFRSLAGDDLAAEDRAVGS